MRQIIVVLALIAMCSAAMASPQCTSESKEKWISESEMKSKVVSLGYQVKVFKVTKGNCYELYGLDRAGKRIEVYFHPITGKIVEEHKS